MEKCTWALAVKIQAQPCCEQKENKHQTWMKTNRLMVLNKALAPKLELLRSQLIWFQRVLTEPQGFHTNSFLRKTPYCADIKSLNTTQAQQKRCECPQRSSNKHCYKFSSSITTTKEISGRIKNGSLGYFLGTWGLVQAVAYWWMPWGVLEKIYSCSSRCQQLLVGLYCNLGRRLQ